MKIEFVDGNGNYGGYNTISDDNELLLGRFCCNIEKDTKGKTVYKKRKIYIVKQNHWRKTLLVLGHELLHSFIDIFYPAIPTHPLHKFVDKYLSPKVLNK